MEDSYYRCLAVMDRIREETIKEYGNLSRLSIKMGYSRSFLGTRDNQAQVFRIPLIVKIAQELNVSVDWLLSGKNKQPFRKCIINYEKLIQAYDQKASENKKHSGNSIKKSVQSSMCFLKKNISKNLNLATLFYLSDILHVSIADLVLEKELT